MSDSTWSSDLVEIGTWKSNNALKARLTGSLRDYTALAYGNCEEASIPSTGRYEVSLDELSLELTLADSLVAQSKMNGGVGVNTTKTVRLYKLKIYIDNLIVRTIDFYNQVNGYYGSSTTYNYAEIEARNLVVYCDLTIPFNATKNHTYKQNGYYGTTTDVKVGSTKVESENSRIYYEGGYHRIYVEIVYSDEWRAGSGVGSPSIWTEKTVSFELGNVYIYPLTLNSITATHGTAKHTYYMNETLDKTNVRVYSHWYYHSLFGGNEGGTYDVTADAQFTAPSTSTPGTKAVNISYGGKSTSYNITVLDYASGIATENSKVYYKYLIEPDAAIPTQVTFKYSDGSETTVSATSANFTWTSQPKELGNNTWTFTARDANTTLTKTVTVTKVVRDAQSISLGGTYKTVYNTNESFSSSGLTVTADYGEAGTYSVPSNKIEIVEPDLTTIGTKAVTVKYRGQTATYNVSVNGLSNVRLYVPNEITKFLKGSTGSLTTGLKIFVTTTTTQETEIPLAGNSDFAVNVDTSNVNRGKKGTYEVSVSVTHKGNTITKTYEVEVITLDSITCSNYKSEFVYSGSAPTFSAGGLIVTAHMSDGSERSLNASEYSVSAPDNMEIGTHTVTVTATIGDTVSTTYNISVVEDYPDEITSVDLSGWNDTFVEGSVFSAAGIVVKATMHSGLTNKEVDFSTSLDGQVFGTDITAVSSNFSIIVETNGEDLEVAYNSDIIEDEATLTAKYDKLNSISVNAGSSTGLLRWTRAGEEFTDYINENNHITVTASYQYGGNKTIARGLYDICVLDDGERVKEIGSKWTKDDMGDNTVTVSFGGKTATYTVRISVLNGIAILSSRSPNKFNRGQDLDLTELTIKRFYTHDGENDEAGSMNLDDISKVTITGHTAMTPDNNDGLTHDVWFSYTEAGVTKQNYLTVTVKALASVVLDVNKVSVNYGGQFTLAGHSLTVTFNDEDEYELTIATGNKVTISGTTYDLALSLDSLTITSKVENVTVGMSFGGETKYSTFTIHCIYLDSITLDASYYSGTLYAGDTIALENLSVTKTIKSTDENDSNYPATSDVSSDAVFNISDGQVLITGNNTITARYEMGVGVSRQERTSSVTLTANAITLSSINVESTDPDDLSAMLSYVEGQSLNLSDLVVSAVFNRTLSNRDLALTECKVYIESDEKYYTAAVSTSDNGKKLIVAYTYEGVTKTCEVGTLTVVARALTGISIRVASTHKTSFLYGDKFTTEGLIIETTYNDGYEGVLTSGFTTDYDAYKSVAFTDDNDGTKTVTVVYTEGGVTQTATYNITIAAPSMVSLRLDTSLLNTSVTNGTVFSITPLVVYGVFENGYEEQVTFTAPNITTELALNGSNEVSFASTNLGVKSVTIQAVNPYDANESRSETLSIAVTPNLELVDIRLKFDSEQDPYNYRVGDVFNAKGLTVQALFKDTEWMDVAGFETSNPPLGTLLRSGGRLNVLVSYTSQGVVKTQEYSIIISMPYDSGIVEENPYRVAFNVASVTHEEATIEFSPTTQLPLFHRNLISVDNNQEHSTYGLNVYTGNNANGDCIGYIKLGATSEVDGSTIENGGLVLWDDPVNPIDGDGNIIVKFPHHVPGYADRINKCHFGIIYNKRLFISGNKDYPNMDWHSSQVNSSQVQNYDTEEDRDLTYFSDLDYCKYGSENSPVKGYDIYRDGTLLVFKGKANHEATIYTRQQQLVNASSYDGNLVSEGELAEEAYPCFEVNPNGGSGAISPYSIINFVGETLVLTKNGLKAITSKETTYNNAKYTYDVSSHINNKLLKNNDLDYTIISQYKEKLLVRTDEGLYVGEYSLRDENSEYEWYFCDNIDAYYFFEIDDELYFSDKQGNISRFMEDSSIERKDKPRTYVGLGGTTLSIDANTDEIVVSQTYADKVKAGNEFHLLNKISAITGDITEDSQVYANMGLFIDKATRENAIANGLVSFDQTAYAGVIDGINNEIVIKPYTAQGEIDYERMVDTSLLFYSYKVVFFDNITKTITEVRDDTKYKLKRVPTSEAFDYRFKILDEFENEVNLTGVISLRMSFRVNAVRNAYIMDVADAAGGGKKFKVGLPLKSVNNETVMMPLDLIYYKGRTGTYQGVITEKVNVNSFFVTKPFNFGHDLYQKTIHMWSIINDSQIASMMNVGYIASRAYAGFKIAVKEVGGARQLSFDGLNFEKIHFSNDLLPHIYNRYKNISKVGFMRFIFSNDEGTRMVLSKLDIIYSYSLLMKGVK